MEHCKEIIIATEWNSNGSIAKTVRILGLIVSQNNTHIVVRTLHKEHTLNLQTVLSISDTDIPYKGGEVA